MLNNCCFKNQSLLVCSINGINSSAGTINDNMHEGKLFLWLCTRVYKRCLRAEIVWWITSKKSRSYIYPHCKSVTRRRRVYFRLSTWLCKSTLYTDSHPTLFTSNLLVLFIHYFYFYISSLPHSFLVTVKCLSSYVNVNVFPQFFLKTVSITSYKVDFYPSCFSLNRQTFFLID